MWRDDRTPTNPTRPILRAEPDTDDEVRILRHLRDSPVPVSLIEILTITGGHPHGLAAAVTELERGGLVELVAHGVGSIVRLTDAGRAAARER